MEAAAERRAAEPAWSLVPPASLAPTCFNTIENTHSLQVSRDKLSVKYVGKGIHLHDVGVIRTDNPLPSTGLVAYFEVTIVEANRPASIAVGVVDQVFSFMRFPGQEPQSYGYHGADGKKCSDNKEEVYGPSFGTGDIVGCGLICSRQELFFTRNGKFLGVAFKRVQGKCFPTVALHSPGESVQLNLGRTTPFKFDLDSFIADEREKVGAQVRKQEVSVLRMNEIIHAYLMHSGYAGAAQAFASSTRSAPLTKEQEKSLTIRNTLRQLVSTGNCGDAIALLQREYPTLWERNWQLQMRMQAQHFIELVRKGDSGLPEALSFARTTLGRHMAEHADSAPEMAFMQDVLGLLAYVDPAKSPLAHLLEQTQRDNTFNVLNRTLREANGEAVQSDVEKLLGQLLVTQATLFYENGARGEFLTSEGIEQ